MLYLCFTYALLIFTYQVGEAGAFDLNEWIPYLLFGTIFFHFYFLFFGGVDILLTWMNASRAAYFSVSY